MARASAPGAAPAVATDPARLVVDMKRELMDMVRAAQYESALAVCERLALLAPHDAVVDQYRRVLEEKIELAGVPTPDGDDESAESGEDETEDEDTEDEESEDDEESDGDESAESESGDDSG